MKTRLHISTFSLISQCVLNYRTGLTHSKIGSPFARLKELHPDLELPRSKKHALIQMHDMLTDHYHLPKSLVSEVAQLKVVEEAKQIINS